MAEQNPKQFSMLYRFLGAVPLFTIFTVVMLVPLRVTQLKDVFDSLRLSLPFPTTATWFFYKLVSKYYGLALPVMFSICWLYFGWAAKKRKRLMEFSTLAFLLCSFLTLIVMGGFFVAEWKILDALRRR